MKENKRKECWRNKSKWRVKEEKEMIIWFSILVVRLSLSTSILIFLETFNVNHLIVSDFKIDNNVLVGRMVNGSMLVGHSLRPMHYNNDIQIITKWWGFRSLPSIMQHLCFGVNVWFN